MRIIAGSAKGIRLAPVPAGVRPMSDRAREGLFSSLGPGAVEGARVLDLFAGSGALGLEAMSRGAPFCLFVEESADARASIRRNVEALSLTGVTKIWRRDATKLGEAGTMQPFDLIFLDPPYGRGLAEQALASARTGGWLAPGALVVVEEAAKPGFTTPEGFDEIERRNYDDSALIVLRHRA